MDDQENLKEQFEQARREFDEFGGWRGFRSGNWLWLLIQKSFKNYWERATVEYLHEKYGNEDPDRIAKKLISVTAKNAALLGAVTATAVSVDEVAAVVSAGWGGVGLPANVAIGAVAVSAEAVQLVRFQLQLVANLGKLYGAPLDPDDPEDILTILAFALGGSAADAAGKAGMKLGGNFAGQTARSIFSKDLLAFFKKIAARVGVKLLQRNIVKYTIPVASIGIGTGWNYVAVKTVGRIAIKHFKQRAADANGNTA